MTMTLDRQRGPLRPSASRLACSATSPSRPTARRSRRCSAAATAGPPFPLFRPRRAPLTYVRATTPEGAQRRAGGAGGRRAAWSEVGACWTPARRPRLRGAPRGGRRRAGRPRATACTARGPPPAWRTSTATYRVGIGETGRRRARAAEPARRRPLGIREVTNPAAAHDWAPAETLEEARTNAPLRIRTLDRAVSVADHEDFAAGFAGVGPARADLVWDGRGSGSLLTVLGRRRASPARAWSPTCTARSTWPATPGRRSACWPANGRGSASGSSSPTTPPTSGRPSWTPCIAALDAAFGAPARAVRAPVTAAGVLVVVRSVPGVMACTMPRLFPLATVPGAAGCRRPCPGDAAGRDVVTALPGRCEDGAVAAGAAARARRRRGRRSGRWRCDSPPSTDATGAAAGAAAGPRARAGRPESGGLLRALLDAVAGELDVLERDIDEPLRAWFVETCAEWVVPYLADLVGVADLPPDLPGATVSRRAFVANTVAYRRRKGTVAVLEQVARDVTGWPARAVEYYRLLAATAHVNHVRLDRPATAALRDAAPSGPARWSSCPPAVAQGALDPLPHTAEVRRIASAARALRHPRTSASSSSRSQVVRASAGRRRRRPDGRRRAGRCTRSAGRRRCSPPRAPRRRSSSSRPRRTCRCRCARAGCSRCCAPPDARRTARRRRRRCRRASGSTATTAGRRADPRVRPRGPRRRRRPGIRWPAGRSWSTRSTGGCTRTATALAAPSRRRWRSGTAYGGMADVGAGTYDRTRRARARPRRRPVPRRPGPRRSRRDGAGRASSPTTRRARETGVAEALDGASGAGRPESRRRHVRRRRRRQRPLPGRPDVAVPARPAWSSSPRLADARAGARRRRGPGPGVYAPEGLRPHLAGHAHGDRRGGSSVVARRAGARGRRRRGAGRARLADGQQLHRRRRRSGSAWASRPTPAVVVRMRPLAVRRRSTFGPAAATLDGASTHAGRRSGRRRAGRRLHLRSRARPCVGAVRGAHAGRERASSTAGRRRAPPDRLPALQLRAAGRAVPRRYRCAPRPRRTRAPARSTLATDRGSPVVPRARRRAARR